MKNTYVPSPREQAFLDSVESPTYKREIMSGLGIFFNEKAPEDVRDFYSAGELDALRSLKDTERDVESRMPVKMTRHYYELAKKSSAIRQIVKARPDETNDLQGSEDPGHQMDYSPVEGLLHKYEMGLMYVVSTCSSHCRFCYREELISRKEVERHDGTVAKKGMAQVPDIVRYIKEHNALVEQNGGLHPETGREKLREILLSGGDPMVLNEREAGGMWLAAFAESGHRVDPYRHEGDGVLSAAFRRRRSSGCWTVSMRRIRTWGCDFMVHFEHPDEIPGSRTTKGEYVRSDEIGFLQVGSGDRVRRCVGLVSRGWI